MYIMLFVVLVLNLQNLEWLMTEDTCSMISSENMYPQYLFSKQYHPGKKKKKLLSNTHKYLNRVAAMSCTQAT